MKFIVIGKTKTGDDIILAVEAENKQAAEKVFICSDLVIDRVFTLDEFWAEHKVIQIK